MLCPVGVACLRGVAHKVTSPPQGVLKTDSNSAASHGVLSVQTSEQKSKCEKEISPPQKSLNAFFFFLQHHQSDNLNRLKLKMELCKLWWEVDIQLWPY